jgi:erythronate-4-phosphate dehydrogenase
MQDGYELKGKTLGIIGVGYVGSKVAALAQIPEMNVLLNDPPRARMEGEKFFIPVEKLIADSDIVTLHVPLYLTGSDKTYHLANEAFFSGIRKRIYFINTSRGEVVDGLALKKAVKLGKIKACVLDVWENEPDIDTGILRIARLATPHIAGYSVDGKVNGTKMCVDTINRFFNFGMDDQRHIVVPQPKQPLITINCSGKSPEKVLLEAILGTYSIEEDDHRLRSSPRTFELQRNDYPIRREFPAYSLQLINPVQNIGELLENLGFKVMQ